MMIPKVLTELEHADLSSYEFTLLQEKILLAIDKQLDRNKFNDGRRVTALEEWDFWWDALAWSDDLQSSMSLETWILAKGDCWMLTDKSRGRVWRVSAKEARKLKFLDAYFVPVNEPNVCFVTTHEDGLGPWVLDLEDGS